MKKQETQVFRRKNKIKKLKDNYKYIQKYLCMPAKHLYLLRKMFDLSIL